MTAAARDARPQDTLLVYHTAPIHDFDGRTGLTAEVPKLHWYKSKVLASQLNAAGREVARRLGLGVLDMETMLASKTPSQYLRDEKHPNEVVILESLNVLLNMVEQSLGAKAAKEAAAAAAAGGGARPETTGGHGHSRARRLTVER
jgi:hypothetical protein